MRPGVERGVPGRPAVILLFLLLLPASPSAAGYRITLQNGNSLSTPEVWEEKGEIKFRLPEGIMGLPKAQVVSVEKMRTSAPKWPDPAFPKRDRQRERRREEIPSPTREPGRDWESRIPLSREEQRSFFLARYEEAYVRYLEAASRRDLAAKQKAWEDFNRYGGQVIVLEEEMRKEHLLPPRRVEE